MKHYYDLTTGCTMKIEETTTIEKFFLNCTPEQDKKQIRVIDFCYFIDKGYNSEIPFFAYCEIDGRQEAQEPIAIIFETDKRITFVI